MSQSHTQAMRSRILSLNGQSFFLREWGDPECPKILLLHGFPEFSGAWDDLGPLLAPYFHVIAPDQRGYGLSWAPPEVGAYTTSKLVGDMVALIKTETEAPVVVMGHDWGAAVAYGLAMFRPDLVSHLIIANGVHPVPFQRAMASGGAQTEASQYILFLRKEGSEDILAADNFAKIHSLFTAKMDLDWLTGDRLEAYRTAWGQPGRLRGMVNWYRASPLLVAKPGETIQMPPLPLDKLHVPQPHLLLWGEKDTALLPESTEGLEEFAPHLTRVALPEANHWLIHQQPETLAQHILGWLPLAERRATT